MHLQHGRFVSASHPLAEPLEEMWHKEGDPIKLSKHFLLIALAWVGVLSSDTLEHLNEIYWKQLQLLTSLNCFIV